jgi:hypothetical protein
MIRKLAALAGLGLAALLLYGLQKTMPTYGNITSPITLWGKAGETLTARNFALTVKDIRVARAIKLTAFGRERLYSTSGVWALVEVEAAALNETITLTSASWLGRDGARYTASERLSNAPGVLTSRRLEPGLTSRALLIFEFPENELIKGQILIARAAFLPLDNELYIDADLPAKSPIYPTVTLTRGRSLTDWSLTSP